MKEKNLPIGTVIKTKKGKLAIITGHSGGHISLVTDTYIKYDYTVVPYPFDCMNVKVNLKSLKKYDWFHFGFSTIESSEIEEIIFMGYQEI